MKFCTSLRKILFVFLLGLSIFCVSKDYDREIFFNSAEAAYSGLTDAEKSYLKSMGYSDSDISALNTEASNYVSKGGANSFSDKSKSMWSALMNRTNDASNVSFYKARQDQIENEKNAADKDALLNMAKKTLTLNTTSKNNYELIHSAFTSIQEGCWFCPVFETLFSTVNSLAATTNSGLANIIAGGAGSLLWILLYGYILYVIGKAFLTSAFKEISGMDLVSQIFMPFLACLIATILINNWKSIYTYLLDPLLIGAIGMGQEIQKTGVDSFSANANLSGITVNTTCDLSSFGSASGTASLNGLTFGTNTKVAANFVEIASTGQAFSNGVGEAIQCFLKTASQSLIAWMTIGATFMADCWKAKIYFIFPNIQMFIIGLIVFVGAFLIFVSFPLKLIDSVFRLMFISAMMPLWIAFWVIPQTRGYSKKAWGMLVHVMFTFVILSVVLVMVLQIIGSIFTKSVSGIDISELTNLLSSDKASDAMQKIDFSGVGIFLATALMYLAFSLIGKSESFIGHFADGGGSVGVGADLSKHVTKGVQKAGATGAHAVGAASRLTTKGIKAGGSKIATSYRNYKASKASGGGTGGGSGGGSGGGAGGSSGGAGGGGGSGGGATPKPKVSTSSSTEKLSGGKSRETTNKTYTDADGKLTHKETSNTVKDANGVVESKSQRRENYDPASGNKTGSTQIDTRYNKDGTSVQTKTDFDAMDRKKSTVETSNSGTIKTEFDDAGREKTVTMKDRDGNTSVQRNHFDASGRNDSFFTESKNAAGAVTEKFKVDLNRNVKLDLLTGRETPYTP